MTDRQIPIPDRPRTGGHPFGESSSGQRLLFLPVFFTERTTEIGQLISSYLGKEKNLEDHTVHLLFSANRWEHV